MEIKVWQFENYEKYTASQIGTSILTRDWPVYMDRCKQAITECMKDWDAGCKVLDSGSGDGYTMDIIRDNGFNVSGIDIDPARVKTAISFGHEDVQSGDMTELPWPDNTFDIVYNRHALEHVITPEEVLREFLRVLKVGGHLSLIVPIVDNSDFRRRHPHLIPDLEYVKWLLEKNRFEIVKIEVKEIKWGNEIWAFAKKG